MNSLSIRRATLDDINALTDLSYTTFWDAFGDHPKNAPEDLAHYMSEAFSVEQITAELSDPKAIFLLAEVEGQLAGYSKLICNSIETGVVAQKPIELNRLYSHQKYLGQGVGQALMDACFDLAKTQGYDTIWLGVWEYNPRAKRFYEKNGFTQVGSHTFVLGSDPQTDLLMQKDISPRIGADFADKES